MPSRVFAFVQTTLKKNPALSYAELRKIAKRKGYNVPTVVYNRAKHLAGAVHRHAFSAREKEWLLSVRCPKSKRREDKDYYGSLTHNFNKEFGLNLPEVEVVRACRNFHRTATRRQTVKYTPEEDQYILELREKGLCWKEAAKVFNKHFGGERSSRGLQQRGVRLALIKGLTLPEPATNGVVYVVTIDGKVVHRGPKKPEVAISREQEIARL